MNYEVKESINFQDLMLHRIHEILLVASPYDAFILEEDGRLTQQILYEYLGMNLSYAPRVWHARGANKALEMLSQRKYDMIIVMMRITDMDPVTFGEKVKKLFPKKPVILLAFDQSEIKQLPEKRLEKSIDKVFIWSGNANVFPAIIKVFEDKKNLKRDYTIADIRSILVVEDNPRYYSILMPLLYKIALKHARNLINTGLSDTDKLLMFRARPKILLTTTYEEALKYYNKYRNNFLGIISDVRFPMKGTLDPHAGVKLTKHVKEQDPDLPIILQSTNKKQAGEAHNAGAQFLHKHSANLLLELEDFIVNNFGFGDFIFRTHKGKEITRATDLISLKKSLEKVSEKSLYYHASHNHFSNWMAVRGELSIASELRPIKVHHFNKLEDLRNVLVEIIDKAIQAQHKGQITAYSETAPDTNFARISTGSLGGKARGLAFANSMLAESGIPEKYPQVHIQIPKVTVIGTDEFDRFMDENNLWEKALSGKSNASIISAFRKAKLSKTLVKTLSKYLSDVKNPIAIRSSSLLEDSQYQPLAGMYATFMLPNKGKKKSDRLSALSHAIKMVYASTYFKEPKSLIESSVHRQDEEKMGVIMMELVGQKHGNRFYPTVSGSAQSYNYYPVSYMEREEGVAFLALGLGRTIVEGEKALRFSPRYPGILPQYYSVRATMDNSQKSFYALNLSGKPEFFKGDTNVKSFPLSVAEEDGELHWAASVICEEDNVVRDSLRYTGPRVLTFPPLLKWNQIPVPEIISDLLAIGEQSLGCPVELEFAVNLFKAQDRKPEFSLLQIKPMVIGGIDRVEEYDHLTDDDILCSSGVALGNGIIEGIRDIVVVNTETFNAAHTQEIANEIELMNSEIPQKSSAILVGPGRWGSADPWLGIPVNWGQISKAKVIVEVGMKQFPIDPSFGSHFFQNVTSMRIGYFTIDPKKDRDTLDLPWLTNQPVIKKTSFTTWYRLEEPLTVYIDGKSGDGMVIKPLQPVIDIMDEQESTGI